MTSSPADCLVSSLLQEELHSPLLLSHCLLGLLVANPAGAWNHTSWVLTGGEWLKERWATAIYRVWTVINGLLWLWCHQRICKCHLFQNDKSPAQCIYKWLEICSRSRIHPQQWSPKSLLGGTFQVVDLWVLSYSNTLTHFAVKRSFPPLMLNLSLSTQI